MGRLKLNHINHLVVTHPNEIEVGSRIAAVVATIPNNAIGLWPLTGYMNEIVGVNN
jgi:hypothetical protein